jgi:hypothetical protein
LLYLAEIPNDASRGQIEALGELTALLHLEDGAVSQGHDFPELLSTDGSPRCGWGSVHAHVILRVFRCAAIEGDRWGERKPPDAEGRLYRMIGGKSAGLKS